MRRGKKFLTVADIAAELELSPPTVRLLLTTYEVPIMKLNHGWRVRREDALVFVAQVLSHGV
jgi:hypothetical protein